MNAILQRLNFPENVKDLFRAEKARTVDLCGCIDYIFYSFQVFASTVKLINDDQLGKLGIATVASLRQMCEQNARSELYKFKGQVYNWHSSLPRVRPCKVNL